MFEDLFVQQKQKVQKKSTNMFDGLFDKKESLIPNEIKPTKPPVTIDLTKDPKVKQGVIANLPEAIKETVTNPIKKVGGFFKNLFREEKPMVFPTTSEKLSKSTAIAEREQQQGLYKEPEIKITPKDLARVQKEKQAGKLSETSKFINETVRKSNIDVAMGATEPLKSVADKAVAKTIANIAKSKTETNIARNLAKIGIKDENIAKELVNVSKADDVVDTIKTFQEAKKYKTADDFVKAQETRTGVEVRDKIGTKLQDPYTAKYLPTNNDGTITLYHSTTKEGAEKIKQYGLTGSKTEGGDIYFTTNKNGYGGIGKGKDEVLAFNIDPKKIKFDDVYRGELHLKGNNTDIGGIKPIEIKTKSQLTDIWNKANETKFKELSNEDALIQEAKKYKTADDFVKAQEKNNPLLETAKDFENADDFISFYRGSSTQYGKYKPEIRKFGTTEESIRVPELGVDPEKKITIYRGIDTVQGGKMRGTINDGDFVTTDFDSANAYTGGKVVSKEVKAKDLILDYPEKSDFENPFYKGAEFIYSNSKNQIIKRSDVDLKKIFDEAKSYQIKIPLAEWEKQSAYIQKNGKIPPNADLKGYSKSPEYNKYGTTERQRTSSYYEYVSNKIDEAVKTKSQLTEIWNNANKATSEASLLQEARKYKSAEEFVNKEPSYFHTTKSENVSSIEKQGFNGKAGDMSKASGGTMQEGVFLYPEKSSAEVFGKNFKSPSVIETKVNGKIYDANNNTKYGWEDNLQTQEIAKDPKIIAQLKKDGYVGVKSTELGTDAVFVFDKLAVKTKSQLTDIWNKANKKAIDDITNEMGFAKLPTPMVKAAQSIYPIKQQNATVKSIFKDWTRGLLTGEEKANQYITKFKKTGATVDDLLKYEKGEASKLPKEIKQEFDTLRQKAQDLGLKVKYRENYIPQVYDNTQEEIKTAVSKFMEDNGVEKEILEKYIAGIGKLPEAISKRLKLNPSFIKARALPDYATAIKYGLKPKYTEPAQLLAYYDAQLSKTTANNKFIDELIAKKQITTVEGAGENWEALNLPFSPKGYYAEPKLAQMLNGMFRNEEALGFAQSATKFVAKTSKLMQEINLSAGVPFTGINFFSTGIGLVKNLTAGEFKSAAAFVRSNFNEATIKYFAKNQDYLTKMANQGIDISNRAGNYKNIYKSFSNTKGIGAKLGMTWDKMFQEKTFNNLLPMNQLDTFKGVYDKAVKKGMEASQAEQLAGDTVKAFYGLMENVGRGKGTEDALSAVFFAPKFREGIINTLINTGKSVTTEIFNPAFRKNRNLLAGMVLTYAGYNALNKKLTGHYMWDNPDGKEFDLMIPTKFGNTQDDVIYTSFMPSFLSFARNMSSGAIALTKGDMSTAKQKFGSVFSMPIKLGSELWANKDYFGRDIYNEKDDKLTKLKKMAGYVGLQINHPFIRETYRQITTDKPLYQSMSEALELPIKFSSYTKIEKQQFYEAIEKQKAKTAQEKAKFKPTYDNIKSLIEQGNIGEAQNVLDKLSDEDYKKYKSFATADKQRANINEELKIYDRFNEIQGLIKDNDIETAQSLVDDFNDEEYAAYIRLKNKIK